MQVASLGRACAKHSDTLPLPLLQMARYACRLVCCPEIHGAYWIRSFAMHTNVQGGMCLDLPATVQKLPIS